MGIVDLAYRASSKARRLIGIDGEPGRFWDFFVPREQAADVTASLSGDLVETFRRNEGRSIIKWVHYFPIYERYLAPFRGSDLHMLEIGVYKGGSLEMWRSYFGPQAVLFGIDINPECAAYVDPPNQVRIGSQSDGDFLKKVVGEMGRLDVVLDDGSHLGRHQIASFQTLFPLLRDGGLYIIEDLHAAYWPKDWEGGYRRPGTGIEFVKAMIDDMHHWYHGRKTTAAGARSIAALHVYDSMVIIEKQAVARPMTIEIGADADRPQRM